MYVWLDFHCKKDRFVKFNTYLAIDAVSSEFCIFAVDFRGRAIL